MSIEGQGHFFTIYFPGYVFFVFTRPRYQVSVYRTIGPLVFFNFTIDKIPNLPRAIRSILPVQFMYINEKIEMEMM